MASALLIEFQQLFSQKSYLLPVSGAAQDLRPRLAEANEFDVSEAIQPKW
jgi:hypothetical protein